MPMKWPPTLTIGSPGSGSCHVGPAQGKPRSIGVRFRRKLPRTSGSVYLVAQKSPTCFSYPLTEIMILNLTFVKIP